MILGREVIEILPDGVKHAGKLAQASHSGASESWFQRYSQPADDPSWIIAVSPDGTYAADRTHVFSLKTRAAVSELPVPSGYAVFLAESQHICVYDAVKRQLVIYALAALPAARAAER